MSASDNNSGFFRIAQNTSDLIQFIYDRVNQPNAVEELTRHLKSFEERFVALSVAHDTSILAQREAAQRAAWIAAIAELIASCNYLDPTALSLASELDAGPFGSNGIRFRSLTVMALCTAQAFDVAASGLQTMVNHICNMRSFESRITQINMISYVLTIDSLLERCGKDTITCAMLLAADISNPALRDRTMQKLAAHCRK